MIHYQYKAKRKDTGEIYEATLEAADRYELYRLIRQSGSEVVSFKSLNNKSVFQRMFSVGLGGINMQEKIHFARNLGSMIQAGLAPSRALSVMERQTKKQSLKKVINSLNVDISKGKTLAESMQKFPKVFSSLFISMVKAGANVLVRRIRGALMYPAVVVVAMIIIAVILLTYIVPTLLTTFTGLNVKLPASTLLIVNLSNLLRDHGVLIGFIVIILLAVLYIVSRLPKGKSVLHYCLIKLPIIGSIVVEVNVARTARTLSSLLSSGVDVVDAVKITEEVLQNVHYKRILLKAGESIKKGQPLSKIFSEHEKLYPTFITEMISVGEETGKMGEMLLGVAIYYEDDIEQQTKDMSSILEPVIMVVIGGFVGFFAIAVISPIYSLVNVIS